MPVLSKTALRGAALTAAERGWPVFPLRPDNRPDDPEHPKKPAFPDHTEDHCGRTDPRCTSGHTGWEPRATTDYGRIIRAWAFSAYGVGIACGPAGLVVIDLDAAKPGRTPPPGWNLPGVHDGADVLALLCERAGQPFPNTYTVATGGGGLHLYFRHPPGPALRNTAGERGRGLGWLIDTRAHGGYVVAAGSTAHGRPYQVLYDTDPIVLPEWLAVPLRPEPARPAGPVVLDLPADRTGSYLRAAINRTLTHLGATPEGERNHALFMAAQSLGQLVAGGALTEAAVTDALTPTARQIGLNDREITRTIRSGLCYGARRPRTVAA